MDGFREAFPFWGSSLASQEAAISYRVFAAWRICDMIPELLGLLQANPFDNLIPSCFVLSMNQYAVLIGFPPGLFAGTSGSYAPIVRS